MKITIKEYAKSRGISYENVRLAIKNNQEELKGLLEKEGRTTYLTDKAQKKLNSIIKTKNNTVTILTDEEEHLKDKAIIEELKERIKVLEDEKEKIELKAQNEILRIEKETLLKVSELKEIANNGQLLLEQKDKDIKDLEKEQEEKLDLIASNRQARRKYNRDKRKKKKAQRKKDKELEKQNKN